MNKEQAVTIDVNDKMNHIKPQYTNLYITICVILNITLSISIVFLNKMIFTHIGFPNITLTMIHFIFTGIGMAICQQLNLFTFKRMPLLKMLPITLTFCGFVVLTNLSLESNTVGTYQIIKSLTTPGIILIQSLLYKRTFSIPVKLTIIPIIVGVFLNSYFDIKFNVLGITYALSGVVVTSLYQVWVNEKQLEFNCDSMQLLFYQAPLSAICIAIIVPFFEPIFQPGGLFGTSWDMYGIILVSSSGVVAFAINLSIFWIIGNTSPLTYNMAGHLKFCLTVTGGFLLFHDPLQIIQFVGICITFSGILLYTHFKMKEQNKPKTIDHDITQESQDK